MMRRLKYITRNIQDLQDLNLEHVTIVHELNDNDNIDIFIYETLVNIAFPPDYPYRSPLISYTDNENKQVKYRINDWNPCYGLKSIICEIILSLQSNVIEATDIAVLSMMSV